jgi:hypothetical protein
MKTLVTGCSFSSGYKFPEEKKCLRIWPKQLAKKLDWDLENRSCTGANNHQIFLNTVQAMTQEKYDCILVAWTAIPRYNYHVGLELYDTQTMLNNININVNVVGHNVISGSWLEETGNRLRQIHNDHWDILTLIKYVNILTKLQTNNKIFFVNSLCPWSLNYFDKKRIDQPSDLDSYTYQLLDCDQRSDQQISDLYDMIHRHYFDNGGIKKEHWINLYHSFFNSKIDTVEKNDVHPGPKSQDLFTDLLYNSLKEKI